MDCARNIITANFSGGGTSATTAPLWQWDYGQVLCITGIEDLPAAFEVHFSTNKTGGVSTVAVGADGQVTIPNALLTIGKNLNAWIYLSDAQGEGETEYSITIPVKARPMPETYDAEVSGEFDDVVRQVSEYAQTAQTAADNAGASASAAATSASEAAASASAAESAKTAAETAQGKAEDAQAAAETAAQTATQKAQQTAQDAARAAQSKVDAESAAGRAEAAHTGAESAKTDAETAAQGAAASASAASASAASAGQAATSAGQSATAAAGSATTAQGAAQTATTKAGEASASASAAAASETAAQTAQTGAETAETNAGHSASTATTKAAEAAQSASNAAASETAAEAAATRAETAAASLTVDDALSDTSVNPVQNKVITGAITDVKSALDEIATYNLFDPNDPTYRAGCYIDGSGNVVQSTDYFVSNHIHAAPGMTFVVTYAPPAGLTNVRAYKLNGSRVGNITGTLSGDGKYITFTIPNTLTDVGYITVNGHTYASEYMIIRGSEYPDIYIPHVALNKSVQSVLTEYYQKLSEQNTNINNALGMVYEGEQSVTISVALQGHFVNATNDRIDTVISFNITNSIALEKGQIISVTAQGYNNVVGMICIYDSDTDKYKTVVRSEDSTVRTYTYTATERCNVRISYNKTYTPVVKIITAETHSAVLEELIDNLNVQNIEYPQLFDNILCIGDSLTVGYDGSGDTPLVKNYPHFMEKLTDANTTLKAHGGWTAKQIWDGEISTATDLANYDCAIIFLGTNGGLTDTVSTDCKTDYTQNADTNTGCYGKIIGKIKAVAPNCKVFCVAGVNDYIRRANTMNPAVRALAEFYNVGLIDVENCIMSDSGSATSAERYLYRPVDGIHYNALGYMTLANIFYDSMSAFMGEHRSMYA